MSRWAGLLVCALVVGFLLGSQIGMGSQLVQPREAQHSRAEEREEKVTEADVEMYIAVYSAMQADHGLNIDTAVAGHDVTLEEFRDLERRVQADQRMVDRVRLALLNQAKAQNAWVANGSAAAPPADPKAPAPSR